jgi:CheY-like chemotaxis protein
MRLELEGFDVLVATTGTEGIALASRERPDLVLMDLDLPDIDGWEATRRIRADASVGDVPIIALSAHAMHEERERALSAGCDDFEPKPVNYPLLLGKIRSLISRHA